MTIKTEDDIQKAIDNGTFVDNLMHDVDIVVLPSEQPGKIEMKINFPDWFQLLTTDTQTTCIRLIKDNAQIAYDSQ